MLIALVLAAGTAGWFGQPLVHRMVAARTGEELTGGACRWISRPVLAGGAALGAGAASFAGGVEALTLGAAATLAWALVCIDAAIHRLPDPLVASLGVVFLLGRAAIVVTPGAGDERDLVRAMLCGAVAASGFALLALARPAAMGFGDVKLAGALGIGVGWYGWEALGQWLLLSFILGGVAALFLLLIRRARLASSIAFGPWLIAGAALAIGLNLLGGVPH